MSLLLLVSFFLLQNFSEAFREVMDGMFNLDKSSSSNSEFNEHEEGSGDESDESDSLSNTENREVQVLPSSKRSRQPSDLPESKLLLAGPGALEVSPFDTSGLNSVRICAKCFHMVDEQPYIRG